MKPTASFGIQIETFDGFATDYRDKGVSLTMTKPAEFAALAVTPESDKNGILTKYSISITFAIGFSKTDRLEVTFPTGIGIPDSPYCPVDAAGADKKVVRLRCSKSGQKMVVV